HKTPVRLELNGSSMLVMDFQESHFNGMGVNRYKEDKEQILHGDPRYAATPHQGPVKPLLKSLRGPQRMSINQGMDKPTVLIVDDDHVSLTLLSKLVTKLEYNVIQAIDGAHAIDVLKKEAVDCIIADYDMPVIN